MVEPTLEESLLWAKAEIVRMQKLIEELEVDVIRLVEQRRRQLHYLTEIRRIADEATGISRIDGDDREPGALGAVKLLAEQYQRIRR